MNDIAAFMLAETKRAYEGLDDESLAILKAHFPNDPIRQRAIDEVLQARGHPSIVCPQCGMRSYNPHDIAERYCGACHEFHSEMRR